VDKAFFLKALASEAGDASAMGRASPAPER